MLIVRQAFSKHFVYTTLFIPITHLDSYYRLCAKDEEMKEVMQLVHRSVATEEGRD